MNSETVPAMLTKSHAKHMLFATECVETTFLYCFMCCFYKDATHVLFTEHKQHVVRLHYLHSVLKHMHVLTTYTGVCYSVCSITHERVVLISLLSACVYQCHIWGHSIAMLCVTDSLFSACVVTDH